MFMLATCLTANAARKEQLVQILFLNGRIWLHTVFDGIRKMQICSKITVNRI